MANDPCQFDQFGENPIMQDDLKEPATSVLDPSEIDTIVVPAHKEGFEEIFIGEQRWYAIRIHSSMIPKIKYIAVYQVEPISSITHIALVSTIEHWKNTSKYVVNFASPPESLGQICLVKRGLVQAPRAPRYTSRARLEKASSLDEAF